MSEVNIIAMQESRLQEIFSKLDFIATEILAIKQKNSKEYLTTKEACQKLKCSRNTLEKYINEGKLTPLITHTGVYQKRLFRNADIEYFLQNNSRNDIKIIDLNN